MKFNEKTAPQGTVRDWLLDCAERYGTRDAYVFTDGSPALTWSSLLQEAKLVASTLTSKGACKSESVAIMMPNGRAAVIAFFGVVYGGFCAAVINLAAGDDAIAFALSHSEARFAFVGDNETAVFERVCPEGLVRLAIAGDISVDLYEICADDHALLMYTSGTTGTPKGVVHNHSSLLSGGWTTAIAHDLKEDHVGFCVLPMCHINGLCVTVMSTLISGGRLVMSPKFSAKRFWSDASDFGVTWFSVVPTIISHLLHGDKDPDKHTKSRIRFGRSASSALAPEVQKNFEHRFEIPIVETMGLTETAAQILSNPLPPQVRKTGSPGIAYGNEVCILSSDLRVLEANCRGEIAVRGPNLMCEYLKNETATREAFTPDGWFRTGDLGHIDKEGYIFVTGRLKELIIKGGENIAPREIDEVLYLNEDVIEAAAFPRSCAVYGERIEAAVRLKSGTNVKEADLLSLCVSRLGKFKSPDCIYVMDELPKGPSGKIQRLQLAKLLM